MGLDGDVAESFAVILGGGGQTEGKTEKPAFHRHGNGTSGFVEFGEFFF